MTKYYERLTEGPQIEMDRASLAPSERQELRTISATARPFSTLRGRYTSVYYLEGDEAAATRMFVEENRNLLERVDFSKRRNLVQTSVSRDIYDRILHELGIREIQKYETVVLETRRDGTQWVIDRRKFDGRPNARYRHGKAAQIPPDVSLTEIFDQFDAIITQDDLSMTDIKFDVRQVLDYFRVAEGYPCLPTTTNDGQLAVKRLTSTSSLVTEPVFARTYDIYDDPWQAVKDYRSVQSIAEADPSLSFREIADRVGIKTSAVRSWLDREKTPAAVKGLEKATSLGWIGIITDTNIDRYLAR